MVKLYVICKFLWTMVKFHVEISLLAMSKNQITSIDAEMKPVPLNWSSCFLHSNLKISNSVWAYLTQSEKAASSLPRLRKGLHLNDKSVRIENCKTGGKKKAKQCQLNKVLRNFLKEVSTWAMVQAIKDSKINEKQPRLDINIMLKCGLCCL